MHRRSSAVLSLGSASKMAYLRAIRLRTAGDELAAIDDLDSTAGIVGIGGEKTA
jgi:hypothetical protein